MTAPKIELKHNDDGTTTLKNVRIGIGFHWDRHEDQVFEGRIEVINKVQSDKGQRTKLYTAVNTIDIEDYLTSVISSEMATTAPMELLKAHAVISRSWAVRAIGHTDHVGYDVCADDHCQRYEGILRRSERAIEAVRATAHEVLTFDGQVCDCRYHKCCGGKTEVFETCWDSEQAYPYLASVECPYCGQARPSDSLNDYDLETKDYHDWTVRYSRDEISKIIRDKSGLDFGQIQHLIPISRGKSGRIDKLEIVGTKRSEIIGKELKIRQWLSPKCLYSSWFDVIEEADMFTLNGHGWGHGVGLCQIGAAVMAQQGYNYREILNHYYPGAELQKLED